MDRRVRLPLAIALLAACVTTGALGQVLFKLTGRDGKVSYVDIVPKEFDGEVVRIEPDEKATGMSPSKPLVAPAGAPATMNDRRRANREDLEGRLRMAQARYAAAAKAKSEGDEVKPEEFQPIQRRYRLPTKGEAPPRANCITRNDSDGSSYLICPIPVPNDEYYARQKAIDEELRLAQEALQDAERNYRRGVD